MKVFELFFMTKIYHTFKEKLITAKRRTDGVEEEDMTAIEETINNSTPPGTVYIELLQTINQQALPGTGFRTLYFMKNQKSNACMIMNGYLFIFASGRRIFAKCRRPL